MFSTVRASPDGGGFSRRRVPKRNQFKAFVAQLFLEFVNSTFYFGGLDELDSADGWFPQKRAT
ncbi:hypothetical protein ROBYS_10360 [Roseobacter sp. OBYS 0001]|nr:hypothetical protein ROBYS_10360 [Roseobacter sp. OBYS 0001]